MRREGGKLTGFAWSQVSDDFRHHLLPSEVQRHFIDGLQTVSVPRDCPMSLWSIVVLQHNSLRVANVHFLKGRLHVDDCRVGPFRQGRACGAEPRAGGGAGFGGAASAADSVDGAFPWAVGHGTRSTAALQTGRSALVQRLHGEDPVEIVKPTSHNPSRGVGKVKGVAQFMQWGAKTCRIVGPVVFPESTDRAKSCQKLISPFLKAISDF